MGNVEREVEFGLEQFATDRKVELPLRDALYAYKAMPDKTIGEPDGAANPDSVSLRRDR
jgi:hypothetical protein